MSVALVPYPLYPNPFLSASFLDATMHLYKRSCPSVGPSFPQSVCPVLFSNDEKRHFLCSDDNEIWHGPRDSQGQFKKDIKMSVRRSVHPSDERKSTKSVEEVVASYEPRSSCFLCPLIYWHSLCKKALIFSIQYFFSCNFSCNFLICWHSLCKKALIFSIFFLMQFIGNVRNVNNIRNVFVHKASCHIMEST